MSQDVKIPSVGESVQEGMIESWHKNDGDYVKQDDVLLELETDKATVELTAETSGVLKILKEAGTVVKVGEVIATIDESQAEAGETKKEASQPEASQAKASQPEATSQTGSLEHGPAVKRLQAEENIDLSKVSASGRGGRVTKEDIIKSQQKDAPKASPQTAQTASKSSEKDLNLARGERSQTKEPMSMLRRRVAERLLFAQQNAAILTTFNEVDMSRILEIRKLYKDDFLKKHGVKLGFMGFFLKASVEALKAFPKVNAYIEEQNIVYNNYYDLGVAVSTEKGLVVPVIRDVDRLSLAEVEKAIGTYAGQARDNRLTLDSLQGGTFTVSNGGVFGSLLSTPILNPPQSAILGMHKTQLRPVVLADGKIEARPMMYLALSYDHRIVDGKESVSFLICIKNMLEDPSRLVLGV